MAPKTKRQKKETNTSDELQLLIKKMVSTEVAAEVRRSHTSCCTMHPRNMMLLTCDDDGMVLQEDWHQLKHILRHSTESFVKESWSSILYTGLRAASPKVNLAIAVVIDNNTSYLITAFPMYWS